ncbi:hypothetical protein HPB52_001325 [Rhipicephalus sanguineus]|uniref:Uncharacterized protein n=1 Tax=Rhipicephalus sanguineus TaxID=34632 RepID=A0A9D4PK95_RHISA|nr:hypothetical protein HPB52_001325 [Rhipicephalus sanguineus]
MGLSHIEKAREAVGQNFAIADINHMFLKNAQKKAIDRASHDTAPKAAVEIAEEFGEEGDEPAEDKVGSGIVLVDFRDSASMRELDGATKDLGGPEAKDGKAEKTRKRRKRKKKRNDDEQRGGVGAKENKAIVDEAIVVDAVAHVRDNTSEPNPESEREDRTEEETKKAEVEKPAADSKEDEETKGDAAPPAKKAKAEPARTRPQRKTKSAGARRVRSLEATAKEGEALLRELVHKDSRVPDSGCRRTRSQTRCTTAAPAARQLARKPPAKPARALVHSRFLYGLPFLPMTPTQLDIIESINKTCIRIATGLPKYAKLEDLYGTGLLLPIGDYVEPALQAQNERLKLTRAGRAIRSELGLSNEDLPQILPTIPPWEDITVTDNRPLPKHMNQASDT